VAALVVAVIVIYVSLQLGKRAVTVLLDVAPPGLADRIADEAGRTPGVQSVGPVRVRQAGASIFVDLVVNVDRSTSLEEAHRVAEAVDERITKIVPRGDAIVHVDPVRQADENLSQTVSAVAARFGLQTHYVHAHEVRGRYFVDLHVEVPPDLTLGQAHDRVSRLEVAVREELPQVRDIHSHIEPIPELSTPAAALDPEEEVRLRTEIMAIAQGFSGLNGCTRIHIRSEPGGGSQGYDVVLHCLADPDLTVAEGHRRADELETRIQARIPAARRVLVHVAPEGESRSQG
jgi:divalent metal cation (Fe/Co/Zn/Cd) transporter